MPGKMMNKVILKNDSYKGFDKIDKIDFMVLPPNMVKRAEIAYDDEDIQAVK